jgi:uncharacterized membrane protein YdjX (TVP38/TMEM64 family)
VEQNSCYNKQKLKASQIIIFLIVIALLGCILYFTWPFLVAIGNPEQVRKMVVEAGAWGSLVFILLQVIQVFIAPIPGLSFIAGLTTIRIRTLVLISLAGRLPGYIMLCLAGNELAYDNLNYFVTIILVMAILFTIAWWKRKWLRKFVEHNNRISFIIEQWKSSKKAIILWDLE